MCFVVSGAEHGTAKGSARAFDHNALIHSVWMQAHALSQNVCCAHALSQNVCVWMQALLQHFALWVYRVPTDDNLSDLPSRGEYELIHELGAVWHDPCIAELYLHDA